MPWKIRRHFGESSLAPASSAMPTMSEARKPVRSAVVKPDDRMPSTTTKASPVAIQFGPLLPSAVPHWNTQVHIGVSGVTIGTSQARSPCFFTWCRNSSASDLYCAAQLHEVLFRHHDADVGDVVRHVDVPHPGRGAERVVGADARAHAVVAVREARAHHHLARADRLVADAEGAPEHRDRAGGVDVEAALEAAAVVEHARR